MSSNTTGRDVDVTSGVCECLVDVINDSLVTSVSALLRFQSLARPTSSAGGRRRNCNSSGTPRWLPDDTEDNDEVEMRGRSTNLISIVAA